MATPSTSAKFTPELSLLLLVLELLLVVELDETVVKSVKVALGRDVPGSLAPSWLVSKSICTDALAILLKSVPLSNWALSL